MDIPADQVLRIPQAKALLAQGSDVTIPEGVTRIEDLAFSGQKTLARVSIPRSVTGIGYRAFAGCTALVGVSLSPGVATIELEAFYQCEALTSITIPESVTGIGASAFAGCTALTSVTISRFKNRQSIDPQVLTDLKGAVFVRQWCYYITSEGFACICIDEPEKDRFVPVKGLFDLETDGAYVYYKSPGPEHERMPPNYYALTDRDPPDISPKLHKIRIP